MDSSLLLLYNCRYNQRQRQKYRPLCEFSITDLALLLLYNYSNYSIAPSQKSSAAQISLCCYCIIVTTTGQIKVSPPLLVQTHGFLCCYCIIVITTDGIKVSPSLLVQTHGSLSVLLLYNCHYNRRD